MKNPNFFYAVLSNIPIENIEREKKIRFLYEYEEWKDYYDMFLLLCIDLNDEIVR